MSLTFGTDGVRGDARGELTPEFVEALGCVAAAVLGGDRLAVGRDPRVSGPDLVGALRRGVRRAGGSAVDLGVLPTPAVARWCEDEQVAGAMVSASHNPWHDNGVKLFAPGGCKLDDQAQREIEGRLAHAPELPPTDLPTQPDTASGKDAGEKARHHPPSVVDGPALGLTPGPQPPESGRLQPSVVDGPALGVTHQKAGEKAGQKAVSRHVRAVAASLEGRDLSGLRVVIDAANGAAYRSGPECLRVLGADIETMHASPDGYNINDSCGSLHPESLQAAVVAYGADAGVAFDGDADRVLAVDAGGDLVDGDQILAVCAIDRARRGRLRGGAVVATVMANLGLRQAMAAHGIDVVETPVGDRHVLGALEKRGLVLGGEQSGHLIFRDLATTGDGLLTAVQLLDSMKRSGRSLRELAAAAMTRLPQVLLGVPLPPAARRADLDAALGPIAASAAARLGDSGRVLLRPSGTEPLVRVMVEASDLETARAEADRLSAAVAAALN